jgi:hypothetical protein
MSVQVYCTGNLPGRWVGRASAADICKWPLRSPDLTVWFFLLGFRQGQRLLINNAIENDKENMLEMVWREWEYARIFAASHLVRTSNAFKVNINLQILVFQMPVRVPSDICGVSVRGALSDERADLSMGRPFWWEDGSIIYSYKCYWALPALWLLGPTPIELETIYFVSFEIGFALCRLLRLAGHGGVILTRIKVKL